LQIRVVDGLSGIAAGDWDALAGGNPFASHAYLSALIDTGCASARTGWQPQFLILERAGRFAGALPLFVKSHSRGEYVFDWAWADAYFRHGLEYYPKLLAAIPFTPVCGPRILAATAGDRAALIAAALDAARQFSSLHVLFPLPEEAEAMQDSGMLMRRTVQFHWRNPGYADFEEFLAHMSHHRRKNIRQERRRVRDADVRFRCLRGTDISVQDWDFFHRCYAITYAQHRSRPYLNREFFRRVGDTLSDHTILFLAERNGNPVAASFCVATADSLYGRYWGAIEHIPLLHFEACYYQPIEFAIANRLSVFEGGAQGEHKLFRGLLPVETVSAHWLAHPQFARAIEDYLERETEGIARYVNELNEHSPFKDGAGPAADSANL
jgi:predicted N-acyltransferase